MANKFNRHANYIVCKKLIKAMETNRPALGRWGMFGR